MKPQLGSSKGFVKRNLLRPSSGLSKQREFLKTVDISQSEAMISSTIRSELSVIQESISLLDKDKRIRSSEPSLQKSYIGVLKKWIRENGSLAAHFQKQDDDKAILRQMGVQTYETAFRKLWKIICNLDLMISKIMELQIVHLVKYDQMFHTIGQDSDIASGMLSAIAKGGFNPAMFHVVRVSLERSNELYTYTSDLKRKNPNTNTTFTTQNQTNQLIEQLRSQNNKLTNLLNELQKQPTYQPQPQPQPSHQLQSISQPKHTTAASGTLEELQEKYKQYIQDLNSKITKLNQQSTQNKLQVHSLQKKLSLVEKEIQDAKEEGTFKRQKASTGSYEEALVEEMEKMKKGFEKKIKTIQQQHQQYQREQRRKQYEYKTQCDRIRWEKSLLLKKFDLLSVSSS